MRSAMRMALGIAFVVALAALSAAAQSVGETYRGYPYKGSCDRIIGTDPFDTNKQLSEGEQFVPVTGLRILTAGRSNPQHAVWCDITTTRTVAARRTDGGFKLFWLKDCGNPIYDWEFPRAYNPNAQLYTEPQPQPAAQMPPQQCPPGFVQQGNLCYQTQPTAQANALVSLGQAAGQPSGRPGLTETCKHVIVNGQDQMVCRQAHPNRDKIVWAAIGAGVTAAIICGTGHCNGGGDHHQDGHVPPIRIYPAPGPGVWYPPTQP